MINIIFKVNIIYYKTKLRSFSNLTFHCLKLLSSCPDLPCLWTILACERLPVLGHVQHLPGCDQMERSPGPRTEHLCRIKTAVQHHAGVEAGYLFHGFSDLLWLHSLQVWGYSFTLGNTFFFLFQILSYKMGRQGTCSQGKT